MKVAYCTTVLPSCRRTGGEIASQAFVDALRAGGHTVDVLGYRRPDDASALGLGEQVIGERHIETDRAGRQAYVWLLAALTRGQPYSSAKYVSQAYVQALLEKVLNGAVDLVVIDHAQMGFLARYIPPSLPFVFVAHNVEAALYEEQCSNAGLGFRRWLAAREARLIRGFEHSLVKLACQTWVLSLSDRAHFGNLPDSGEVIPFDLPGTVPQGSPTQTYEFKWDVGLIGTWSWEANAAGLRWLQSQVLPLLDGNLSIAVAGKGAQDIVRAPLKSLGFVDDATAFMRSCRVVCVPSVAGAGVQIKTLDAIATGRPVVATETALRGISDPPRSVRWARSAPDFAKEIADAIESHECDYGDEALAWSRGRLRDFCTRVASCIDRVKREHGSSIVGAV